MQNIGFDRKLIWGDLKKKNSNPKGGPFGSENTVFATQGGNFSKKKFCVFGSLSNMSKNGLRMVVHLNFDITHLSD